MLPFHSLTCSISCFYVLLTSRTSVSRRPNNHSLSLSASLHRYATASGPVQLRQHMRLSRLGLSELPSARAAAGWRHAWRTVSNPYPACHRLLTMQRPQHATPKWIHHRLGQQHRQTIAGRGSNIAKPSPAGPATSPNRRYTG